MRNQGKPTQLWCTTECVLLAIVFSMTAGAAWASVTPFEISIESECRFGPCAWDAVYTQYMHWHQRVTALPPSSAECDSVSVLVWHSNAGLGDSLLALASAVLIAMKTGRAFFIDWTEPHGGWHVGLSLPASSSNWLDSSDTWNWDWHAASCKQAWAARSVADTHTIAHVFGAVTAEHWILDEVQPVADAWARRHAELFPHALESPAAAKFAFEYIVSRRFHVAGRLLRPSAEVLKSLGNDLQPLNSSYVIGLQIRTGSPKGSVREGRLSLSEGDETQFFKCYAAIIEHQDIPADHKVVLVSDRDDVISAAQARFGDRLIAPFQVPVEHSHTSRSQSRQGLLKAFVDLFALSKSNAAFITNWSLFGRAALEIGLGAIIGVGTIVGGSIGFYIQEIMVERDKADFENRVEIEVERRRKLLLTTPATADTGASLAMHSSVRSPSKSTD